MCLHTISEQYFQYSSRELYNSRLIYYGNL